jgi:hypothetical protein
VFYAYIASASVTFVAGIPLVIHLGLRGAVYGMLLSALMYSATLLTLWRVFNRQQTTLESRQRHLARVTARSYPGETV